MTELSQQSSSSSTEELALHRTDYALERTHLAATRTFFALFRTGLAIAGGGTLITTILADGYPDRVIGLLSGVFIVVGFFITIGGLRRDHAIAKRLAVSENFETMPVGLISVMTALLMAATIIVLMLYLLA